MRILVVSNLYPPVIAGGYEVECAVVVERLRRDGHDVTVLTGRTSRPVPVQPGVCRELPVLTPDWRGTLRAPGASIAGAKVMRRVLDEMRPDLVYVWNGAGLPMAILAIALDSPSPVAFRVCEHWFGRLFTGVNGDQFLRHLVRGETGRRAVMNPVARLVNRHPALRIDPVPRRRAAVSWISEALRDVTGMPTVIDAVVEQVLHAVPPSTDTFAALERRPVDGPPLLAYVGRVSAGKGAAVAARALARIRRVPGLSQARLVMAGAVDDSFRSEWEHVLREVGLPSDATELLGPVSPARVAELLAVAHVQLVPSSWFEPLGLVCIEGALARIPIVAAASGGIAECLHDEEHALLFPTDDDAACAGAIVRTLGEPNATEMRVARAYAHAKEEFGVQRYLDETRHFVNAAALIC